MIHNSFRVGRRHLDGRELGDEQIDRADVGVGGVATFPLGVDSTRRIVLKGVLIGNVGVRSDSKLSSQMQLITLDRLNFSNFLK